MFPNIFAVSTFCSNSHGSHTTNEAIFLCSLSSLQRNVCQETLKPDSFPKKDFSPDRKPELLHEAS